MFPSVTVFSAITAIWSSNAKSVSASKDCILRVRMPREITVRIVSAVSFL